MYVIGSRGLVEVVRDGNDEGDVAEKSCVPAHRSFEIEIELCGTQLRQMKEEMEKTVREMHSGPLH